MRKRILFVDDEVKVLKSFETLFADTDYEIIAAENGMQALDVIENQEIDLIISDMRMPNMTGYELLSEVKKKFPHIVRVLLSVPAEERIIFDSLQKNIAKLYFFIIFCTSAPGFILPL